MKKIIFHAEIIYNLITLMNAIFINFGRPLILFFILGFGICFLLLAYWFPISNFIFEVKLISKQISWVTSYEILI